MIECRLQITKKDRREKKMFDKYSILPAYLHNKRCLSITS